MFGNTYFPKRYFADRYFPIGDGATPPTPDDGIELLGGKAYLYASPWQKHKKEIEQREEETARKLAQAEHQLELKRAEARQRADELRQNEILAQELHQLEVSMIAEINRLLMERAALVRRIDDEEAALVLLLSMPFSS